MLVVVLLAEEGIQVKEGVELALVANPKGNELVFFKREINSFFLP
jgi:hypothetical protein